MKKITVLAVMSVILFSAMVIGALDTETADSETINTGSGSAGALSDTTSDDGNTRDLDEENTGGGGGPNQDHQLDVRYGFSTTRPEAAVLQLNITVNAFVSGGSENFPLDVYNYTAGTWESTTLSATQSSDTTTQQYSICSSGCDRSADPANYIDSNGNMRIRWVDGTANEGKNEGGEILKIDYQAFEVEYDGDPPDWRNQGQNTSVLPSGDPIELRAQGIESTTTLEYAMLSTNETGTWQNYTSSYGSLKAPGSSGSWTWTNFTWDNDAISDTTVGWRIWYNDTAGNYNATDIMTFQSVSFVPPDIDSNETYNRTNDNFETESFFLDTDKLGIRSNITDINGDLSYANVTIRDPSGTKKLSNASMTNLSTVTVDGHSGAKFEKNYTFSDGAEVGEWNYTIWGHDDTDRNTSITDYFSIKELNKPLWRSQQQNASSISVTSSIKLSAQGKDDFNLTGAILSTNETGSWQNKTVYGSPKKPYTGDTYTWTNFTWSNQSLTENTTVGWRIWYNDTWGNYNVTDTKSFKVTVPTLEVSFWNTTTLGADFYNTYNLTANITCNGQSGAECGQMKGSLRYNDYDLEPSTIISTDTGSTPFFIQNSYVNGSSVGGSTKQGDKSVVDDASDLGTMPGSGRRIVQISDDVLYSVFGGGSDGDPELSIFKSADGGESWSEKDDSNAHAALHGVHGMAIDSSGDLNVLRGFNGANDYAMGYTNFSTSSDTYVSREKISTAGGTAYTPDDGSLAIDGNNVPHVVMDWGSGSDGYTLEYANRAGGSWSITELDINHDAYRSDISINENNEPEISFINATSGNLVAAQGDANDPSSFTYHDIDTTVNTTAGWRSTSIVTDSSGNTWIGYVDDNDQITLVKHNDGDAWTTWQTPVSNGKVGAEPMITANGNTIYAFYENSTDDIVYDKYDGSSWSGETTLEVGNFEDIKPKWQKRYSYGNGTDIDYLFSNGTDVFWNKLTLGSNNAAKNPLDCGSNLSKGGTCNLIWTVNATEKGGFNLDANFSSDASYIADKDTANRQVNTDIGWLNVSLKAPEINPLTVSMYDTFWLNATVNCEGDSGDTCGDVSGGARYNASQESPVLVNTSEDTPFYIASGGSSFQTFSNSSSGWWTGANSPDSHIESINSALMPGESSWTNVTVNVSNFGQQKWNLNVSLWNYSIDDWSVENHTLGNSFSSLDGVSLGDVDSDGSMEIVASGSDIYLLNRSDNGEWNIYTIYQSNGGPDRVSLGDVDGDGSMDIVFAQDDSTYTNITFLNRTDSGKWNSKTIYSEEGDFKAITMGDIDDDSSMDIVFDFGTLSVLNRTDSGNWNNHSIDNFMSYDISLGDVDSDGSMEIVSVGEDAKVMLLNRSESGLWKSYEIADTYDCSMCVQNAYTAALGDIDRDGKMEVVVGDYEKDISIVDRSSSGWEIDTTISGSNAVRSVSLGDVDSDGSMEIAAGRNNGGFYLFNRSESGLWKSYNLHSSSSTLHSVSLGDVDGDGGLSAVTGNQDGNITLLNQTGWNSNLIGSEKLTFDDVNGSTGTVNFSWVPEKSDYNLLATVDSSRNYTNIFRTTADSSAIGNRLIQNADLLGGTGASNPQSCGALTQGQSCQLNWSINATGNVDTSWFLDANFTSDTSGVEENDTTDNEVCIGSCPDGDASPPNITIHNPLNTTLTDATPDLKVTANESVDTWLYNLDSTGNVTFTPNITLSSLSDGQHDVNVWANDSANNFGLSTRYFTVDTTPPTYRNVQDNSSGSISPGKPVNISAEVKDETSGVDMVYLATNETGSFQNKTENYSSPKDINSQAGSYSLVNFTWSNSSITSNYICWKLWSNDTKNQWSVTGQNCFDVSSSQSFSRNVSDGFSTSESPARSSSTLKLITGDFSLSESLPELFTGFRELVSTFSIGDSVEFSEVISRVQTDVFQFNDQLSIEKILERDQKDTFDYSPAIRVQSNFLRDVSGSFDFKDSMVSDSQFYRSLNSIYKFSDTSSGQLGISRKISQGIEFSAVKTSTSVLSRTFSIIYDYSGSTGSSFTGDRKFSEAYTYSDSSSSFIQLNRNIQERIDYLGSISRSSNMLKMISETWKVDETVSRSITFGKLLSTDLNVDNHISTTSNLERVFSTGYDYSSNTLRKSLFGRSVVETFDYSTNQVKSVKFFKEFTEVFQYRDSSQSQGVFERVFVSVVDYSSTQKTESLSLREFTKSIGTGTIVQSQTGSAREFIQEYSFNDATSGSSLFTKTFNQAVDVESNRIVTSTFFRAFGSSLNIADQESRSSVFERVVTGNFDTMDIVSEEFNIFRSFSADYQYISAETTLKTLERFKSLDFSYGSSQISSLDYGREFAAEITYSESIKSVTTLSRLVQQTFTYQSVESSALTLERIRTENMAFLGQETSQLKGFRSVAQGFNYDTQLARTFSVSRNLVENFGFSDSSIRSLDQLRTRSLNVDYSGNLLTNLDYLREFSQTFDIVGGEKRSLQSSRKLSQTFDYVETSSFTLASYRVITQSVNVFSDIKSETTSLRYIQETLNYNGVIDRKFNSDRILDVDYDFASQQSSSPFFNREYSQGIVAGSQVLPTFNFARTLTLQLNSLDETSRTSGVSRILENNYLLKSSESVRTAFSRILNENIDVSESSITSRTINRVLAENLNILEQSSSETLSLRLFSEDIDLTGDTLSELSLQRMISENLQYTSETSSSSVILKEFIETMSYGSAQVSQKSVFRQNTLSLATSETISSSPHVFRLIAETVSLSSSTNELRATSRTLSQSYDFLTQFEGSQDIQRVFTSDIDVPIISERFASSSRVLELEAALSNSQQRSNVLDRTVTLVNTYSVPAGVTGKFFRTESAGFSVKDVTSENFIISRLLSQSYLLSEENDRKTITERLVDETYRSTGDISTAFKLSRVSLQSIETSITISRSSKFERALSETYSVAESITSLAETPRSVSLNIETIETVQRSSSFRRLLNQNIDANILTSENFNLKRIISSDLGFGQETGRIQNSFRLISQQLYAGLDTENSLSIFRTQTSELQFTGLITRSNDLSRSNPESIFVAETASSTGIIGRTISSGIELSATVLRTQSIFAEQDLQLEAGSEVSERSVIDRFLDQTVSTAVTSSVGTLTFRDITGSFSYDAETQQSSIIMRLIQSNFEISNDNSMFSNSLRDIQQGIEVTSPISTSFFNMRSFTSDYIYSSNEAEVSGILRSVQESFEIRNSPSTSSVFLRRVSAEVAVSALNPTNSDLIRTLSQDYELGSQTVKTFEQIRAVSEEISTSFSTENAFDIFRTQSSEFGFTGEFTGANILSRTNSESIFVAETVSSTGNLARAVNLGFEISETIVKTQNIFAEQGLQLEAGSEVSERSVIDRFLDQTVSTAITSSSESSTLRGITGAFGYGSDAEEKLLNTRLIQSSLELGDDASMFSNSLRDIQQGFQAVNQPSASFYALRSVSGNYLYASNEMEISEILRLVQDSLGIEASETTELSIQRIIFDKYSIETIQNSESNIYRQFTSSFAASLHPSYQVHRIRELGLDITTSHQIETSAIFDRALNQVLEFGQTAKSERDFSRLEDIKVITGESSAYSTAYLRLMTTAFETGSDIQNIYERRGVLTQNIGFSSTDDQTTFSGRVISSTFESTIDRTTLIKGFRQLTTDLNTIISRNSEFKGVRILSEDLQVQGQPSSSLQFLRELNPVLAISEERSGLVGLSRTVDLSITQEITQLEGQRIVPRAVGELYQFSSDTNSEGLLTRVIESSLDLESNRFTGRILSRTVESSLGTSIEILGGEGYAKVISQTLNIVGTQEREDIIFSRILGSDLMVSSSEARQNIISRTINMQTEYSVVEDGYDAFLYSVSTGLGFSSDSSLSRGITREITQKYGYTVSLPRTVTLARSILEPIGLDDELESIYSEATDQNENQNENQGQNGPGGGAGGQGGAGGGGGLPESQSGENKTPSNIILEPDGLEVKLNPGESVRKSFTVKNTGNDSEEVSLLLQTRENDILDFVTVLEKEISLEPGEEQEIDALFEIPDYVVINQTASLHRGVITSDAGSDQITTTAIISSSVDRLLDLRLQMPDESLIVNQGKAFKVEVFNLGTAERVDIILKRSLYDSDGNEISFKREELAVETSASIVREIETDLSPGKYTLNVTAEYADKDATATSTFRVEEESSEEGFLNNLVSDISLNLPIIGGILTLFVVVYFLRKLRKKKKKMNKGVKETHERKDDVSVDLSK